MKIAFVSSEVYPFSKTGGLADVSISLPVSLKSKGVEIIIITPLYSSIDREQFKLKKIDSDLDIIIDNIKFKAHIFKAIFKNITIYFIESKEFFNIKNFYEGIDVGLRFGFFCYSAIELCKKINFCPDIFHINDWQTSLIPVLLKKNYSKDNFFKKTKTLLTIHNIAYQGYFSPDILPKIGLSFELFNIEELEFYGQVNFLKGGIVFSDFINTVSPTYAKEILTQDAGRGLAGVLQTKRNNLSGILNGIDYDFWNPEKDTEIFKNYNYTNLKNKKINKSKLQNFLNFEQNQDITLFGFVGRIIEQKGFDLICEILPEFFDLKIQFVFLGTGEEKYKRRLNEFSEKFPEKIKNFFKYDESLARKIYAGADFFLMPSQYEPCGISQLISMRYGTPVIARKTGGLADTVSNECGIIFEDYSSNSLTDAILKALEIFVKDKNKYNALSKKSMLQNFSWDNSAQDYIKLYKKIKGGN